MDKNEVLNKLKKIKISKANIHQYFENLQANGKTLIITIIISVIVMLFFCGVVFFAHVKGPEEVMVPNVVGKQLTTALIEMQKKELYPKITLRYSDVAGDENSILDQNPKAGSIVKGYSRVSLVVSRGAIVESVENYVGSNYEELKLHLQTLFAGSAKPLIILAEPQYKPDVSEAGTILEQDPPEGTDISEPVVVHLVVSRGPTFENTRVPKLVGMSVENFVQTISRSKIVFDVSSRRAAAGEKAGLVVAQQEFDGEFIPNYTRMTVEIVLPAGEQDGNVYGVFTHEVVEYPYPIPMEIRAEDSEGVVTTYVSFLHNGGHITIPYAVKKDTKLSLWIDGRQEKVITAR